jgi:hypothetical protein
MTATREPTHIRAGDSVAWIRAVDGCPASAGWVLAYRLVPRAGGEAVDITSSAAGDDHAVSIARAITGLWAADEYTLAGAAILGTDRVTVYSGTLVVLPDLMVATAHESRSVARQIVDGIDEYFRTRDRAVIEKTLGDRGIKYQSDVDLIRTRNFYASQLMREDAAAGLAQGLGVSPGRIQVRM